MFRIFLAVLIPYALILSALLWRRAPSLRARKYERPIPNGPIRVLVIGATGGTGCGSKSSGLDVAQTWLVAMRR